MAEEAIEEQVNTHDVSTETPVSNPQKKSFGWLIFGVINLIFILILTAFVLYTFDQINEQQIAQDKTINKGDDRELEFKKEINTYQSQLASMQSQIAVFNEEITGKDNHYTKALADYSQLQTEKLQASSQNLENQITFIKRQLGKTRGDWLIADAEYLLNIANQRLHLVGDVATALLALEGADQRLRESGDSAVYKVREQIAREIDQLKAVKQVDTVGLHANIQTLKNKVDGLAMLLPYPGKPLTQSDEIHAHENEAEAHHGILDSAISLLKGYVTVRHSDIPITKVISEEEVSFIKQLLGVKLEMIKIALVKENHRLFEDSIKNTRQWLREHFTINTEAKSFLVELDKLEKSVIHTDHPDVSQSLKMLKDITKLQLETDKALSQDEEMPDVTSQPAAIAETPESETN